MVLSGDPLGMSDKVTLAETALPALFGYDVTCKRSGQVLHIACVWSWKCWLQAGCREDDESYKESFTEIPQIEVAGYDGSANRAGRRGRGCGSYTLRIEKNASPRRHQRHARRDRKTHLRRSVCELSRYIA